MPYLLAFKNHESRKGGLGVRDGFPGVLLLPSHSRPGSPADGAASISTLHRSENSSFVWSRLISGYLLGARAAPSFFQSFKNPRAHSPPGFAQEVPSSENAPLPGALATTLVPGWLLLVSIDTTSGELSLKMRDEVGGPSLHTCPCGTLILLPAPVAAN